MSDIDLAKTFRNLKTEVVTNAMNDMVQKLEHHKQAGEYDEYHKLLTTLRGFEDIYPSLKLADSPTTHNNHPPKPLVKAGLHFMQLKQRHSPKTTI